MPISSSKEELGLDHFEGRSWTGFHRYALMSIMAYALLAVPQTRLGGTKSAFRPPPQLSLLAMRQAILDRIARPSPTHWPHCGCTLNRRPNSILPK